MKRAWVMIIAAGMAATVSQMTWAQDEGADKPQTRGHRQQRGEPGQHLKEMDKDSDGKVTWDEFKAFHEARMRTRFEARDTNKDGVLSREDRPGKRPGTDAPAKPAQP